MYHDTVNEKVRGRKGARLAALTSGGAIPEIGDYRVVAEPDDTFIGTVNEDWAVVGYKEITRPADSQAERTTAHRLAIRTTNPANTARVDSCWNLG